MDVRNLRDALTANSDWADAGYAYARSHAGYFDTMHRIENWMTSMFLETEPEADLRRRRAMPNIASDPTRMPDIVGLGPRAPADETARRHFFSE